MIGRYLIFSLSLDLSATKVRRIHVISANIAKLSPNPIKKILSFSWQSWILDLHSTCCARTSLTANSLTKTAIMSSIASSCGRVATAARRASAASVRSMSANAKVWIDKDTRVICQGFTGKQVRLQSCAALTQVNELPSSISYFLLSIGNLS